MLTVLILVVFAVVVLVLILLVVVVVAIRQEPRDMEMSDVAPSLIAVSGPATARGLPAQAHSSYDGRRARKRQWSWPRRVDRARQLVRQAEGGEKPLQAYTVEQVAKMLHVGRDKVYYLLRTGQLRSLKIGKLRRITEQQLAEFIASLDDAPCELGTSRDVLN